MFPSPSPAGFIFESSVAVLRVAQPTSGMRRSEREAHATLDKQVFSMGSF